MTPATITIDGVELCVPMDSPYFFRANYEGIQQWMFSPFEFDKDSSSWSHDRDFPLMVEDNGNYRPIIAAVAHLYWTEKAIEADKNWEDAEELKFAQYADAWARVAKGAKHV